MKILDTHLHGLKDVLSGGIYYAFVCNGVFRLEGKVKEGRGLVEEAYRRWLLRGSRFAMRYFYHVGSSAPGFDCSSGVRAFLAAV